MAFWKWTTAILMCTTILFAEDSTPKDDPASAAPKSAAKEEEKTPVETAKPESDQKAQSRTQPKEKTTEGKAEEKKEEPTVQVTDSAKAVPAVTPSPAEEAASQPEIACPANMVAAQTVLGTFIKRDHAFCIDLYEFPNKKGHFPTANVTWKQADEYCRERGKRLCRDKEWIEACKGPKALKYPYGAKYEKERCRTDHKYMAKAGAYPECASHYGVFDMVGNVAEWTGGGGVVYMGGNWKSGKSATCGKWTPGSVESKREQIGFRCCADPSPEP